MLHKHVINVIETKANTRKSLCRWRSEEFLGSVGMTSLLRWFSIRIRRTDLLQTHGTTKIIIGGVNCE